MTTRALTVVNELDRYIAEVNRFPTLTPEEELRLALKWREDEDISAAHALVTANLRFVVKIAYEYKGYGARMLDVIQEGSIGLMQAVKKFDPDRGYRLLTYAVYWIRSYIHTFLMSSMRMIKVGTSRAHRKLFFKLRSLKGKLAAAGTTNHDDVIDAVASEVGVDRADVIEMEQHFSGRDASLDAPVQETGASLVEILPAEQTNQEDMLADLEAEADRAAMLETALNELGERERMIIEKRHLAEDPTGLKELASELGVSKQRVSQLERRAIDKLKGLILVAA